MVPIFTGWMMLLLLFCSYFLTVALWFFTVTNRVTFLTHLASIAPVYFAAHALRQSFCARRTLISDLETFDLDAVGCREAADKEFVQEAIMEWYGSTEAFTEHVRGSLRNELLASTMRNNVPRTFLGMLATAPLSGSLEGFAGLYQGGAPWRSLLSYFVGHTLGIHLLWWFLSMRFLLYLCNLDFKRRCGLLDWLQTLLVFLAFSCFYFIGGTLACLSYSSNLGAATAFASVALFLNLTPAPTFASCARYFWPGQLTGPQPPAPRELHSWGS